jgi:hypothetical protein
MKKIDNYKFASQNKLIINVEEKMGNLNMNGPYQLNNENIDAEVTKTSPGNYALGYSKKSTFYVKYVGRSDTNLNKRLKNWVDEYKEFKYSYASSPKSAFEKECSNFHEFGEADSLDNENHPQRPDNSNWKCPQCNLFNN